MKILIDETTDESCIRKFLFPTLQQILDLKVQFKENFDALVLFDYQIGTIDLNSYFSKIAFIKDDKLYIFTEYENAESRIYEIKTYSETDVNNLPHQDLKDFFIESRHHFYQLKYPETFTQKRLKI